MEKLENTIKIEKEITVYLSLFELTKDSIYRYLVQAEVGEEIDRLNFVFGETTQVKFSILIDQKKSRGGE